MFNFYEIECELHIDLNSTANMATIVRSCTTKCYLGFIFNLCCAYHKYSCTYKNQT